MPEILHPVADTGFTILHAGPDALVDFVLVHGIQGHPFKTWSSTKDKKTGGLFRNVLTRSHGPAATAPQQSSQSVFWPRTFLAEDFPKSRILTFGYDSRVSKYAKGASDQTNIFGHAKNLLYALSNLRRTCRGRRIVFIAHSLGGIIVKEVLRRSNGDESDDIKDVVQSTAGVFFMGTPHRGSGYTNLSEQLRRVVSALGFDTSEQNLRALAFDSIELELSREEFLKLWNKHGFVVRTFQESTGFAGVKGFTEKVVPDFSTSLDDQRERAQHVPGNHMSMCRFASKADQGYVQVSGEIAALLDSLQPRLNEQTLLKLAERAPTQSEESREVALLRSLSFSEIHDRSRQIISPSTATCKWIFHHPDFLRFQEGQCNFLWLKGKPGSGKSVLMKHLFAKLHSDLDQIKEPGHFQAAFYFDANKSKLERSVEGLLRSLTHQILLQDTSLLRHISAKHPKPSLVHNEDATITWTVESLKEVFMEIVQAPQQKSTILCIDGLDEGETGEIRSILDYFNKVVEMTLATSRNLRLLLSSRHYPNITISHCPEIYVEDHNSSDITSYIQTELSKQDAPEQGVLISLVAGKASGLFLWAVIVVEMLAQAADDGEPLGRKLQLVEELPEGLEALFSRSFSKLKVTERRQTFELLKWIIFTERRWTAQELLLATALDDGLACATTEDLSRFQWSLSGFSQISRFFRARSRGLIEIKPYVYESRSGSVTETESLSMSTTDDPISEADINGLHSEDIQSARGFKSSTQDLQTVANDADLDAIGAEHRNISAQNLEPQASDIYVKLIHASVWDFLISTGLQMLMPHVLVDIQAFAHDLISRRCLTYLETSSVSELAKRGSHHATGFPRRISVLTGQDPERGAVQTTTEPDHSEDSWSDFPLLSFAVRYLFVHLEQADRLGAKQAYLLEHFSKPGPHALSNLYAFASACPVVEIPWSDLLQLAAINNILSWVDEILKQPQWRSQIHTRFDLDMSLRVAVEYDNDEITQKLILAGARVTTGDGLGITTFHIMCKTGKHATLHSILENALFFPLELRDVFGRTGLHEAAAAGQESVVQLLIGHHANMEARSHDGETPLIAAARSGQLNVVRCLIQAGANLNAEDSTNRTAGSIAEEMGHSQICALLEEAGATHRPPHRSGQGIDWTGSATPAPPEWHVRSRDRERVRMEGSSTALMRDLFVLPFELLSQDSKVIVDYRLKRNACCYCANPGHAIQQCHDFLSDEYGPVLESNNALDERWPQSLQSKIQIRKELGRCEYCGLLKHSWEECSERQVRLKLQKGMLTSGVRKVWTADELEYFRSESLSPRQEASY